MRRNAGVSNEYEKELEKTIEHLHKVIEEKTKLIDQQREMLDKFIKGEISANAFVDDSHPGYVTVAASYSGGPLAAGPGPRSSMAPAHMYNTANSSSSSDDKPMTETI